MGEKGLERQEGDRVGVLCRAGAAQGGERVQLTGPHPAEKERADQGRLIIPLNEFVGGEKGVGLPSRERKDPEHEPLSGNHKKLHLGQGGSREREAGACEATRQVGPRGEPPPVESGPAEPTGGCQGVRRGRVCDSGLRPDSQRASAEGLGGRVGRSQGTIQGGLQGGVGRASLPGLQAWDAGSTLGSAGAGAVNLSSPLVCL